MERSTSVMVVNQHYDKRGVAWDWDAVCPGEMMLGERWSHLDVDPLVMRNLEQAVRLIDWWNTFLCRFERNATGLGWVKGMLEHVRFPQTRALYTFRPRDKERVRPHTTHHDTCECMELFQVWPPEKETT